VGVELMADLRLQQVEERGVTCRVLLGVPWEARLGCGHTRMLAPPTDPALLAKIAQRRQPRPRQTSFRLAAAATKRPYASFNTDVRAETG
jgi:hypothetical protein